LCPQLVRTLKTLHFDPAAFDLLEIDSSRRILFALQPCMGHKLSHRWHSFDQQFVCRKLIATKSIT
jgi:hypothetical protein